MPQPFQTIDQTCMQNCNPEPIYTKPKEDYSKPKKSATYALKQVLLPYLQ